MNAKYFEKQLKDLGACASARKWATSKTQSEAWQQCERADWMLWYLVWKLDGVDLL